MHVILVNESEGKALIRSRRVLSRFLPQIGSSVWAGHISAEGLEDLRAALRKVASKTTAVCCHQVVSRSRLEVAWVVGSKKAFDEAGRYAFRQTAARREPEQRTSKPARLRLAFALLRLAALLHDIGKASSAFDAKLRRGHGAEVLRHDLLSFLVVAESLYQPGLSDQAWLSRLAADPAACCACATKQALVPAHSTWLKRVVDRLEAEKGVLLYASELQEMQDGCPGLLTVLWLVLTHHRLPQGDALGQLDVRTHLNVARDEDHNDSAQAQRIAPLSECLKPAQGTLPWEDSAWQESVRRCAQAALEALQELQAQGGPPLPSHFWTKLSAHALRPLLVLSDHIASMQAAQGPLRKQAFGKGVLYANLYDRTKTYAGDTLCQHLLKTQRAARRMFNLALDKSVFDSTKLPTSSPVHATGLPAAYAWQEQLGAACAKAASHGPTFVAVIAETGAGKTLGGLRAAQALGAGELRFTLALGLRSLTWQSARAFLADAQLPEDALTVAVGQPQTLGLAEQAQSNKELAQELGGVRPGSESSEEGGGYDMAVDNMQSRLDWLQGLATEDELRASWGPKALALLSAPVVACTADHLVNAVTLLKGGDSRLFLRLANADLVLDEIDAYSASDLQSIGKLTFVAGLFGRNVVAMSATMGPFILRGLHDAWSEGIRVRSALLQAPMQHAVVFCANTVEPQVLTNPADTQVHKAWLRYVDTVCAVYANPQRSAVRRRVAYPQWSATTRESAYDAMVGMARCLHENNSVLDPATGKQVSIGCVRLNTAKSAWKFAQHLLSRAGSLPDTELVVVPYHAKFPRNYLAVLDATLGQLTYRAKDPQAFLQTPELRRVLQRSSKANVVVVLASTTLVETGRDFDLDWGISEPMSARGLVQFAGRIRRHRRQPWPHVNVFILPSPLKIFDPAEKNAQPALWARPGIESSIPGLRVTSSLPACIPQLEPAYLGRATTPPEDATAAARSPSRLGVSRLARRPAHATEAGPAGADARAAVAEPTLTLSREVLPLDWEQAVDARACLQLETRYERNRLGYLEHGVQAVNLALPSHPLVPSLAWYLSSWAPWNRLHADATRFRGASGAQALFIPHPDRVHFFDPLEQKEYPCLLGQVLQPTSPLALLIPDLSEQAQKLAVPDPHVVGCSLRLGRGGAAAKTLTWSPDLGFLEELHSK